MVDAPGSALHTGGMADLRQARHLREQAAADAVRRQRAVVAAAQAALDTARLEARQAWQAVDAARQGIDEMLRDAASGAAGVPLATLARACEEVERLDVRRVQTVHLALQARAELGAQQEELARLAEHHRQCAARTAALDDLIDTARQRAAVLAEARAEDMIEPPSLAFTVAGRR
jgi:hypothetical protein